MSACSDVTLIDGTRVPSDSEAWRAECEARAVLQDPRGRTWRRGYLERIEKRRGPLAAKKLKEDVMRLYYHRMGIDVTRVKAEDASHPATDAPQWAQRSLLH